MQQPWGRPSPMPMPMPMPMQEAPRQEAQHRRQRVVVDSRERDLAVYPSPAQYELQLDDDIRDAVSMRLLVADVPFPAPLLPAASTALPVTFADAVPPTTATATLEAGDYASLADLADAVQAALNALAGGLPAVADGSYFSVTSSARTGALTVWAKGAFALPGAGRPAGLSRVLGLPKLADVASAPSPGGAGTTYPYRLAAPYKADLRPDRYAVLHVSPNAEVLSSTATAVNRGFAIVPSDTQGTNVSSCSDDGVFEKRWGAPLARIAKIGVRFLDYDGNLYDMQNQDHRIELLFTSLAQPRMYPAPFP